MPVLYPRDGGDGYRTEVQTEITRLIAAGYTLDTPERPPTVAEQQFHPANANVDEVLTYMAENPAEVDRIVAEEKAGQRRVSIVGKGVEPDPEPAPAEPSDG